MTENLNSVLQALRREIMDGGGMAVVPQRVLDQQFHGLTLGQLVLLTDAPALAVANELRGEGGARIEQISVDGRDARQCDAAALRLLLEDGTTLAAGDTRQVSIVAAGAPSRTFVRDHNGVVYRVTDKEAVVDEELTAAIQRRRRPEPPALPDHGPDHASGLVQGLAAARLRGEAVVEAVQKMMWSTGAQALRPACEAASPQLLEETFARIIMATRELDSVLEGLMERARALLLPADGDSDTPAEAPATAVDPASSADLGAGPGAHRTGSPAQIWRPDASEPF